MKLFNLFIIMIVIQTAFVIFYVPEIAESQGINALFFQGNYDNFTTTNLSGYSNLSGFSNLTGIDDSAAFGYSSRSLIDSFLNFFQGNSTALIGLLVSLALFILGSSIVFRSDIAILTPLFILFLGVGLIPVVSLNWMISSEVGYYACAIPTTAAEPHCFLSALIGLFFAGLLYMLWIFSCIEWWSARRTA